MQVGGAIGVKYKGVNKTSNATKLEVVTDGMLNETPMLARSLLIAHYMLTHSRYADCDGKG